LLIINVQHTQVFLLIFFSIRKQNNNNIPPSQKTLTPTPFFHHSHKLQASLNLQISKCIYDFFTTHYQVNSLEAKTNLDSSDSCCWLKTLPSLINSHESHLTISSSCLLYTRACMQPSQFDFGKWSIKVLILSGKSSSFCIHRTNNSSNP
jgi:hypothetical protein